MLQLVAVHATSQAAEVADVEVFPSPPHITGVAGAAAESFHPLRTVVHLVASGHVAQPLAHAVHVIGAAEAKKSSLQAVQTVALEQVLHPAGQAVQAAGEPVGAPVI